MPAENKIAPNIRLALDYSRSFATAKPNIGLTEKEHIEGLANLLERTATENLALQEELERQKRYVEINANSAQAKHLEGLRYRDERDALQEMLNQRDEQIHDLEQRRHAEQQACQAAERRVEELATEVKRLDLMVSQGDYNYDADRAQFKARIAELTALLEYMLSEDDMPVHWFAQRIEAALNPTAEAVSHEE